MNATILPRFSQISHSAFCAATLLLLLISATPSAAHPNFSEPLLLNQGTGLGSVRDVAQLGETLLVRTADGFVYRSDDLTNWSPAFATVDGVVDEIGAANGYVFAETETGVYFSRDSESWQFLELLNDYDSADVEVVGNWFVVEQVKEDSSFPFLDEVTYQATKDFQHWTTLPSLPDTVLDGIAGGWKDTLVLAPGFTHYDTIFLLDANFEWTPQEIPNEGDVQSIRQFGETSYLILDPSDEQVEGLELYASQDLASWEKVAIPPIDYPSLERVGDLWILSRRYVSSDGMETWRATENLSIPFLDEIILLDVVQRGDTYYSQVMSDEGGTWFAQSRDGIVWEQPELQEFVGGTSEHELFQTSSGLARFGAHIGSASGWTLKVTTDFEDWISLGQTANSRKLGFANEWYFLEANGNVSLSTDAADWQATELPPTAAGSVYGNGVYLWVEESDTELAKVSVSEDLLQWHTFEVHPLVERIDSVVFYEPASLFVFVSEPPLIWTSPYGKNWTRLAGAGTTSLHSLHEAGNLLYAKDGDGLLVSENATDWESVALPNPVSASIKVLFANGLYLYGENRSTDGRLWQATAIPDSPSEIFQTSNGFLTDSGLFSTDGTNWAPIRFNREIGEVIAVNGDTYQVGSEVFRIFDHHDEEPRARILDSSSARLDWLIPEGMTSGIRTSDTLAAWGELSPVAANGFGRARSMTVSLDDLAGMFLQLVYSETPTE